MFDPYEALGVPRDASPEEIHAAYRSKAKENHPDKGGNAEAFASVNSAHVVLMDPVKRAKYDETGQFSDGPENIEQAAYGLINSILQQVLAGDVDPLSFDLAAAIRGAIQRDLDDIRSKRVPLVKAKDRAVRLLGRFKGKRAPQFDKMLNWHRAQIEAQLAKFDAAIAEREHAIALMEGCSFDWDQPMHVQWSQINDATTWNTTTFG